MCALGPAQPLAQLGAAGHAAALVGRWLAERPVCPLPCLPAARPQLWQMVHPPKRRAPAPALWGLRRGQGVVRVHSGFYRAWAGPPPKRGSSVTTRLPSGAQPHSGSSTSLPKLDHQVGSAAEEKQQAGPELPFAGPPQGSLAATDEEAGEGGGAGLAAGGGQSGRSWSWVEALKLPTRRQSAQQQQQQRLPYQQQLLDRVVAVLERRGLDPRRVTFYITGAGSRLGAPARTCSRR